MKTRIFSVVLLLCTAIFLSSCSSAKKDNNTDNNASDSTISTVPEDSSAEDNSTETATLMAGLADASQYYGTTFGQGSIIDINVEISEDDWSDIKENATKEEYHSANITVNGTTVNNVGFRTKGFSSLNSVASSDSDRYGFKVKLDEYVDDQTLNGLDTFVLNASFSDPSYMREFLTYAASEYLGCQTPYLSYCRLSINGELFGFYLCIEAYDDSFVARYTDAKDAVLYKAESENCTLLTNDDASGFDVKYGEDDGNSNIKKLITVLNNTTEDNKEELEAILDVDSVLKAIAVNTVMGNYDSYSGSKAHNYYLLYSDGRFSYIGWDYNMSIGGFSEDNGASVTTDISSPVYNVDLSKRPLIEKLLAIPEYKERYMGYLNSLTSYFSNSESMVSGIADVIRTEVEKDPTAFYTIEEFESNITASDTDLSQVQNAMNGKGFNQNLQQGYWQMPDGADGSRNGFGYGQAGMTPEDRPDFGDGQSWTMPEGFEPDGEDGNSSDQADMPERNNNMQQPGGGGPSINSTAVSIIDYITQRIANIQEQE